MNFPVSFCPRTPRAQMASHPRRAGWLEQRQMPSVLCICHDAAQNGLGEGTEEEGQSAARANETFLQCGAQAVSLGGCH
ncbi:hypothetical protein AAFF_G00095890 [Aldrovandia affinis]|uniref:Uncharacterized protein n=1 Tax=Aldrovandia affinis TaxID=143900 RepID=A0AAD7RVT4_9TELE|nr:hypothetical protein AAFF_G00095890 [Aldrovandia affinis]